MHTFGTFHLIATGVLLTGQGVIQANALGWRNPREVDAVFRSTGSGVAGALEERDLAVLADLADAGVVSRSDLILHENSVHKLDCHQRIRQRIKLHCAVEGIGANDSRWDEGERTGVAIALTLCSIESALQAPPSECEPWSPLALTDNEQRLSSFPADDEEGRLRRGRCLEALHRSPQDWSSYNGYLSDAVKQCHIMKGQQTLDVARGIYVNSTLETIALIRMLKNHEIERRLSEDEVEKGWLDKVDTLERIAGDFDHSVHQFDIDLARGDTAMKRQLETLNEITRQALSNKDDFWKAAGDSMATMLQGTAAGLSDLITTGVSRTVEDLAFRLEDIIEAHKKSMLEQDESRGAAISEYVSTFEERTLRAYDLDRERMDQANMQWGMIQNAMDATGKELDTIVHKLKRLDPALSNALDVAVQFKDVSLAHLEESRTISQDLQSSLTGSLAMAHEDQEAWKGLKHDLDAERSDLEGRKAGRSRGALTSVLNVLTYYIFPTSLDYPLVRAITTLIGRYPFILPFYQASKMILHLAFDGMYWMLWITTWTYVLLRTGLWRMMRIVYKVFRDMYEQVLEGPSTTDDGGYHEKMVKGRSDGGRKERLWELPLTPESTPRKNASKGRYHGHAGREEEEGVWRGVGPAVQTSGALGLVFEDEEDVFGPTRLGERLGRAGGGGRGGRKGSLAAKVDRMKRRAQSEPLF